MLGITTHASASCAVYPPSRPTIPRTLAPVLCAKRIASTRLTLTRFCSLPPPTEKISNASRGPSRLTFNQPAYDESHPSSLIRAVSSGVEHYQSALPLL